MTTLTEFIRRQPLVRLLMNTDGDALDERQAARVLASIPAESKDQLIASALADVGHKTKCLKEAKDAVAGMKKLVDECTAPPWYVAVFRQWIDTADGPMAQVHMQGVPPFAVGVLDSVATDDLRVGDTVYLAHERNVIVQAGLQGLPPVCHETGKFLRDLGDGRRLLVESGGRELPLEASGRFDVTGLQGSAKVLFDAQTHIAYEKLDADAKSLFLSETPKETFEDIGGLGPQIAEVKESFETHFRDSEMGETMHLRPVRGCLVVGAPGVGKTLMAKALANWCAQICGADGVRFIHTGPSRLKSMWHGGTEGLVSGLFEGARREIEMSDGLPVCIFFDEIEQAGAARRSGLQTETSHLVLNELLRQLDGLETSAGLMFIAATNREDLIDPALIRPGGRLGDLIIRVPRPDMAAARAIFNVHLEPDVPCLGTHDADPAAAREEIIDGAVARIYMPNGYGEIATLQLAEVSSSYSVRPRHVMSGAVIAAIMQGAKKRAIRRARRTGEPVALQLEDVLDSTDRQLRAEADKLTPENCSLYLEELPRDVRVVDVDTERERAAEMETDYVRLRVA